MHTVMVCDTLNPLAIPCFGVSLWTCECGTSVKGGHCLYPCTGNANLIDVLSIFVKPGLYIKGRCLFIMSFLIIKGLQLLLDSHIFMVQY